MMRRLKSSDMYNRKKMKELRENLESGSSRNGNGEDQQTRKEFLEKAVKATWNIIAVVGKAFNELVAAVNFQNKIYQ